MVIARQPFPALVVLHDGDDDDSDNGLANAAPPRRHSAAAAAPHLRPAGPAQLDARDRSTHPHDAPLSFAALHAELPVRDTYPSSGFLYHVRLPDSQSSHSPSFKQPAVQGVDVSRGSCGGAPPLHAQHDPGRRPEKRIARGTDSPPASLPRFPEYRRRR
ncbi:MAG: hypothetical protein BJ554DRAFT_4891 [Olpidium bornovanus]|uniref:Uncharacterized protein n=1 Tax=Olpidium bornovanus TaxID=278681 RepID=A0A8H8A042_9FUNG|nr:MAG: hypothetical protein BJ554DRAFT_4891 [Olpidium bornovanus]